MLCLVLLAGCDRGAPAPAVQAAPAPVAVATELPDFQLTTIDGTAFSAEELRGKVALIMYWASWCEPCVTEGPSIEAVYRRRKDEGFVMLGVSRDTAEVAALRTFRDTHGFTYPIAKTDAALDARLGAPTQIPAFLLYGRDGKLRWRMTGALPAEVLEREVVLALGTGTGTGAGTGTRGTAIWVVRDTRDAAKLATALKRARESTTVFVVLVGEPTLPPRALNALGVDALVAKERPEGVAAPRVSQYQMLRAGVVALALLEPGAAVDTAEAARRDGGAEMVVGLAQAPGVDAVLDGAGPVTAHVVDAGKRRVTSMAVDLSGETADATIERLLR